ncbi:MAG: MFS transporter [Acutalibacteraceae bacterium]|nr:MFS transporter [Acutalibacteraceae bacterium]
MTALLIVIYIVFVSLGLPDSLFGAAWPVTHKDFGIAENFASYYGIITGVCTGGVSFIAGKMLRKFGTAKVTLVSTFLTAAALVGMSFSPNIIVFMVFTVVLGYGAGAIDTGLNNFISLHYEARHMNWLHCCWGLGVTISPLIMSAFLSEELNSWRMGYRVVALLQLSITFIIFFSLKKWDKVEKSIASKEDNAEAGSGKLLDLLKIKGVITSILSMGLYCGMEFSLGTWGASYAVNTFLIAPDEAAKWVSLYFGGIMLGRVIAGFASMKFSDKTLIRAGIVTALLGIIVFALPLGKISLVGFLLIGTGFGPIFPSILHSVPERFGTTYSADLTGYHMGGAYGTGFAIQLIFGYAATLISFKITPFVLLALCAGVYVANEVTLKTLKKK